MPDSIHGRIEYHSWTCPPHNLANGFTFVRGIAVNGAVLASGLPLAIFTTVKPTAGIISQPAVFFGYCLQLKMVSAIQFYHLADCRFLSFYSAHLSCF